MGEGVTDLLRKVAAAPRLVPPSVGSTQRFQLGRRLGRGQFGEVFVARDREHGGAVALKRLRGRDDDWVYRFKREFRHLADLSHPNVARLYELFEENGSWFLTMELVDGIPFDEHLSRLPEQLESCFSQLANAVQALHSAGVLHRDIKPSNALVEATGRVVLLDFGLAYTLTALEDEIVAGTPLFMAPEQWGGELSEAADWYAFGVMLYEQLVEAPPFHGRGEELLAAKREGPRAPVLRVPGREPLLELALRLLHPSPSERPGYREIAAAFRVPRSQEAIAERIPFVGRVAELSRMWEASKGGEPCWIDVTGEPGMGKTALVRVFLDGARQEGWTVLEGRCHETESTPFKGVDGAVDALCNDLARRDEGEVASLLPENHEALSGMFPVLRRIRGFRAAVGPLSDRLPHARRASALGALRELLGNLGGRHRVCLFIDDLQWAGEDTLDALHALLDPPPPGLLVVTTTRMRAGAGSLVIDRIRPLGVRCVSVELSPLDLDDVSALVAARPNPSMDAESAFRESGGHPYLLSRIIAVGGRSGTLTADLIESVSALSSEARALLEVISLEGQPLTQSAALGAAGIDGFRADVVDELRRQRLVRTSLVKPDALIEPYHDRVRETLLGMLSPEALRQRHQGLALYLESKRRVSPHALAHHYQEAGSVDNARRWVLVAARDAVRGLAFLRADELYRQAVELAVGRERIELRIEWAEAMVQSGRRAHAGEIFLKAAAVAEEADGVGEAAELRARAGEHMILAGDFSRGFELLGAALAAAGIDFPRENDRAIALSMQLMADLHERGLGYTPRDEADQEPRALRHLDLLISTTRALMMTDLRASYVANLALLEALRLGEPRRVQAAYTHFVFASSAPLPGLPIFIDAVARGYELAEELDDDEGRAWAVGADAMRHVFGGEFAEAWPLLREAERRFWSLDPPMLREAGGSAL